MHIAKIEARRIESDAFAGYKTADFGVFYGDHGCDANGCANHDERPYFNVGGISPTCERHAM
jgi:hypothetical protein